MNPDTNCTNNCERDHTDEQSGDVVRFLSMAWAVAVPTGATAVMAVVLMTGTAVATPAGVGGAGAGAATSASTECELAADDPEGERYASDAAEKLEDWMAEDGFGEANVSVHRGRLEVSYTSTARNGDEVLAEENVTDLAVQYMCLVEAGYTMGGIYAQPHTPNGETIGAYQIRKEWAEEYNRDGLTRDEVAEYIADSFDSV